jgi:hypothetical protein
MKTLMFIGALSALAAALPASAAERLATFNRSEQASTASCDALWSVLQNRKQWLSGLTAETLVSGTTGGANEVSRITTSAGGARLEKTLLSEPGRRRIIAMEPEGIDVLGFVDHRLTPQGKGCRIELSLTLTQAVPADMPADYLAQFSKGTQDKIDGDLKHLAAVAEGKTH